MNKARVRSNEKRAPGCLGYIGDFVLHSYMGIKIRHYKDPYKPISIMESRTRFFVAHITLDVNFL